VSRPRISLGSAAALALVALGVAGCGFSGGGDAGKAESLLQRSSLAEKSVRSQTFTMNMIMQSGSAGQGLTIQLSGGSYQHGARKGDTYMTMDIGTPVGAAGGVPKSLLFVQRGGTTTIQYGATRRVVPSGQASGQPTSQLAAGVAGIDFGSLVKDVTVRDGESLNGEVVTKIVGTLDTSALVRASFLQAAAQSRQSIAGIDPSVFSSIGDHVSGARVVLYVSDRTGLVMSALVDLTLKAGGSAGDIGFSLRYSRTSVDAPVSFPQL
jgi:hypothetical protein